MKKIVSRRAESITFLLYMASLIFVSVFHEPWYDEAQSFMIARDASYFDILFKVPHYEGHPPLWHLLLSIPAKAGVPYEVAIKSLAILIAGAAIYLLLFRSPFPKAVRLILPFTYFFFYQYAVIARPYGLVMLSFFLIALAWKGKEEHPVRFALSDALLGSTCAFGLLLAGSIWLIAAAEWIRKPRTKARLATCISLLAFLGLLGLNLLPRSNTYAVEHLADDNNPFLMMVYNFFGLPVEAVFGDTISGYSELNRYHFNPAVLAAEILIGMFLFAGLYLYARRKRTRLVLILPMAFFSVFCAFIYIYLHHIGLEFILLVFFFWISAYTKKKDERPPLPAEKKIAAFAARTRKCAILLALAVSCLFSVFASVNEVTAVYGYGRAVSAFIKKYNLTDYRIMAQWETGNTNAIGSAVPYLPYFDSIVDYNVNVGRGRSGYDTHIVPDSRENTENLQLWKNAGTPDVLIGTCDLEEVYPDGEVTAGDYILVASIEYDYFWKTRIIHADIPIYMTRKLAAKLSIPEVKNYNPWDVIGLPKF